MQVEKFAIFHAEAPENGGFFHKEFHSNILIFWANERISRRKLPSESLQKCKTQKLKFQQLLLDTSQNSAISPATVTQIIIAPCTLSAD